MPQSTSQYIYGPYKFLFYSNNTLLALEHTNQSNWHISSDTTAQFWLFVNLYFSFFVTETKPASFDCWGLKLFESLLTFPKAFSLKLTAGIFLCFSCCTGWPSDAARRERVHLKQNLKGLGMKGKKKTEKNRKETKDSNVLSFKTCLLSSYDEETDVRLFDRRICLFPNVFSQTLDLRLFHCYLTDGNHHLTQSN